MALENLVEKFNKDNSESLMKVLKQLDPVFKEVEATRKVLPKININNLDKVKEIECQTLSHYGLLAEWYLRIESLKKNKEFAYYQMLKNTAEQNKDKFTDGSSKQEAALAVSEERRVRDLIKGKLDFSLETIRTCRNLLSDKQYVSQTSLNNVPTTGEAGV